MPGGEDLPSRYSALLRLFLSVTAPRPVARILLSDRSPGFLLSLLGSHVPALSTEPAAESPGRPRWVKVRKTRPTGWPLSPAPLPGASPLLAPRGPRSQLDVGVTHPEVALWEGGADGREAQQRTADGTVDQGPELQRQTAHGVSIVVPGMLTSDSTTWAWTSIGDC